MDPTSIAATIDGDSLASEESAISGELKGELPKLAPGSVIPGTRLKIVRWLGQGGVGVVFEVRHLDIERRFAAKLLNLPRNPKRTQRFRDEARTISQLGSPYIVEVFDFKELPDGRLMFVMELVDGESLTSECRTNGPLELSYLLAMARQVCKGLADAHDKGFLHRDVKPENIMVGPSGDGRPQVKLVDFGLATLQGASRSRNRGGTPAYMSPEQCQGLELDIRTDVYSLGVSLYELACGRLPFEGQDEQTVRRQHLSETARPPSERCEQAIPKAFDELVLRCMAKVPEERYASAVELEAALIELQLELGLRTTWDDMPVPVLEDERRTRRLSEGLAALREQGMRRVRRLRWVGIGALLLLGLGIALGFKVQVDARAQVEAQEQSALEGLRDRAVNAAARALWVYPSPEDPERETAYRVILEMETLSVPAAVSTGLELREEFSGALVQLGDNYWEVPGGKPFAAEFYTQALAFTPDHERAKERSGVGPIRLARFLTSAASAEFDDSYKRTAQVLSTLASASSEMIEDGLGQVLAREDTPASLRMDVSRVKRALDQGIVPGAEAGAGKPSENEVGSDEPPEVEETGGPEAGETGEGGGDEPVLAAEPGSGSRSDKEASKKLARSATSAYNSGKSKEAERLYRQALAKSARNVDALIGLHNIYFDRSDYRKALEYAERAVKVRPSQGSLRIYAGDACMKTLNYKCARKHYTQAKSLGVAKASKRLERLDEQTGK